MMGVLTSVLGAQQPGAAGAARRFDVVVIKPSTSQSSEMHMAMHDGTLQVTNLYLKSVLTSAFGIREDLISGLPSWAQSARYDITAKMDPAEAPLMNNMTKSARREMIATLLEDRFQLKVHTETKVRPVYEVVLLGNVPKFPVHAQSTADAAEAQAPSGIDSVRAGAGQFDATDAKLPILLSFLEETLETTIIDKTGLHGNYDLRLRWTPDNDAEPSSDSVAPSLFTALQDQLGLKLRPSKGPVQTLVVDSIAQPSAN